MKKSVLKILLVCSFGFSTLFAQETWHGFIQQNFVFEGRHARIVQPAHTLTGNPWVWRAYFPDWHTDMDSILLSRGFHIAYIDCSDMFGSPEAMTIWEKFYDYLIAEKRFSTKPALEGVSRGGLYVYGWAKRNPDKVSCIYAEAPVLNFKTWPGGKGKGRGSESEWQKLLKAWHFTEAQAMNYKDHPVDNLEKLAAFKIPIVHVVSESDSVVPVLENTAVFEANYKKSGGKIRVDYMTENLSLQGHHFSIKDPQQYADFIFSHTIPIKETLAHEKFIRQYGNLNNSFFRIKEKKELTVAFLGGSITQNPGWKDKVVQYLQDAYPEVKFNFVYAGIASLGSVPHAFRLQTDVLDKGKTDLLFIETVVNDRVNKTPRLQQQRALEGIIRHAIANNPYMNMVLMAFADEENIHDYDQGKVPDEIALLDTLAAYYKLPFINLSREVQQRIAHGEFTWKEDFKDLHPSPFGQEIYFQTIKSLLKTAGRQYTGEKLSRITVPKAKYHGVYSKGKYASVSFANPLKGFKINNDWAPADKTGTRPGFVHVPILEASHPGDSFQFSFKGNAVGIAIVSGPDAGKIRYSIDGENPKILDLNTQWSKILHLPWYLILADNLPAKKHTLSVEIIAREDKSEGGEACRIVHFLVNE